MERRDFLKGLGLAGLVGSAAAIKGDEPVDRKERLLMEGRMIAVRFSRLSAWRDEERKASPAFPVGVGILGAASLEPIRLPDDAMQFGDPHFDVCFGCWVGYFVHESFPVAPMYDHLPMYVYVKDRY